ncbi:unnamed protein product [Caenorhabditis auriculariae]|uniref:Uncharacterized protein n=1 Tax=Caenorhabditis auriculariae TaxID=2777116 RepID=A0A8S1GZX2_9PELO|nr:unnamed protein product [Caenorhabditis auriculariae]
MIRNSDVCSERTFGKTPGARSYKISLCQAEYGQQQNIQAEKGPLLGNEGGATNEKHQQTAFPQPRRRSDDAERWQCTRRENKLPESASTPEGLDAFAKNTRAQCFGEKYYTRNLDTNWNGLV